jgi:hypothetical protein
MLRLLEKLIRKKIQGNFACENAEIMNDSELMALLRQSIQEADEGKLVAWEDVKLELDSKLQ